MYAHVRELYEYRSLCSVDVTVQDGFVECQESCGLANGLSEGLYVLRCPRHPGRLAVSKRPISVYPVEHGLSPILNAVQPSEFEERDWVFPLEASRTFHRGR